MNLAIPVEASGGKGEDEEREDKNDAKRYLMMMRGALSLHLVREFHKLILLCIRGS